MAQQQRPLFKKPRFMLAIVIIANLLLFAVGGWWIYQRIWGFGGFYTHVNYIPTPEKITNDNYTTPFAIDAGPKYFRRYDVEQTRDELVAFNQQALPKAGWRITKQGPVTLTRGEIAYCFIIEQRGVKGYITIREGSKPARNPALSAVFISLYEPTSTSWCAEDRV